MVVESRTEQGLDIRAHLVQKMRESSCRLEDIEIDSVAILRTITFNSMVLTLLPVFSSNTRTAQAIAAVQAGANLTLVVPSSHEDNSSDNACTATWSQGGQATK